MEMKVTENGTKKFTQAEKVSILKESKSKGVQATLMKYNLFPATFYYWKRKYETHGEDGLQHKKGNNTKQFILMEDEIRRLKLLLADRDLELDLKNELLKKMYPERRKKRW